MRILEVLLRDQIGGAETLVSGLARQLARTGHEVHVEYVDPAREASIATGRTGRLSHMTRVLNSGDWDLVHAHTYLPNAYARIASLMTFSPPIVITLHSASDDYASRGKRALERLLLGRTAQVVAVSEGLRREYTTYFPSAVAKAVVVPNGIDLPRPKQAFAAGPLRGVAVGRLAPQKGYETLIAAAEILASQGSEISFDVIGPISDPLYAGHLRSLIGKSRAVQFLGPRARVSDSLADYDFFVHTASREAHPIALIEAACAGLPIVTSDMPETRAVAGKTGLFFEPGSPAGLVDAIVQLERTWQSANRAARCLQESSRAQFSIEHTAAVYEDIFNRVAAQRHRKRIATFLFPRKRTTPSSGTSS